MSDQQGPSSSSTGGGGFSKAIAQQINQQQRVPDYMKANNKFVQGSSVRVEKTQNTLGSTAGAGSGDFHQYRQLRRKERYRLVKMEAHSRQQARIKEHELEREDRIRESEVKTLAKSLKRQRKKEKKKMFKKVKSVVDDNDNDDDADSQQKNSGDEKSQDNDQDDEQENALKIQEEQKEQVYQRDVKAWNLLGKRTNKQDIAEITNKLIQEQQQEEEEQSSDQKDKEESDQEDSKISDEGKDSFSDPDEVNFKL